MPSVRGVYFLFSPVGREELLREALSLLGLSKDGFDEREGGVFFFIFIKIGTLALEIGRNTT